MPFATSDENFSSCREMQWLHGTRQGSWGERVSEDQSSAALNYFALLQVDFAGRKRQTMHPLGLAQIVSEQIQKAPDSYFSQATFVSKNRRKAFFSRVRSCWVDLDFYNEGRKLDASLVRSLNEHCDALGLPRPSLIISSGRGAYCKWVFTRSITSLPQWDAAQGMLVLLFRKFCADIRARDACRVFRALGTTNSKSDYCQVELIDGSGVEVDFESFAQALEEARLLIEMPSAELFSRAKGSSAGALIDVEEPTVRQRKPQSRTINKWSRDLLDAANKGSTEELDLYFRLREPILQGRKKTAATLGWARFRDLRDLFLMRGGIPVGQRDESLFWMVNSLAHAGVISSSNWDDEIKALLLAFPRVGEGFDPLNDGSLGTLHRRLLSTERVRGLVAAGKIGFDSPINSSSLLYRPSNKHMIEVFDIAPEEQEKLSCIIGQQEKQRRRDAKAPGRKERREQRQNLKERICTWLEAHGWSCPNVSALARELGEAVLKVWRVVNAILQDRASSTAEGKQKERSRSSDLVASIKDSLSARTSDAPQHIHAPESVHAPPSETTPPPLQAIAALSLEGSPQQKPQEKPQEKPINEQSQWVVKASEFLRRAARRKEGGGQHKAGVLSGCRRLISIVGRDLGTRIRVVEVEEIDKRPRAPMSFVQRLSTPASEQRHRIRARLLAHDRPQSTADHVEELSAQELALLLERAKAVHEKALETIQEHEDRAKKALSKQIGRLKEKVLTSPMMPGPEFNSAGKLHPKQC